MALKVEGKYSNCTGLKQWNCTDFSKNGSKLLYCLRIIREKKRKRSMMPAWQQRVPMSAHVKKPETVKILRLYATSRFTSISTHRYRV